MWQEKRHITNHLLELARFFLPILCSFRPFQGPFPSTEGLAEKAFQGLSPGKTGSRY